MKVLFVLPYPLSEAPSQRFRLEHYLKFLPGEGISYAVSTFWDLSSWKILYRQGYKLQKMWGLVKGFTRRIALLFRVPSYDYIFIHREATPIGLPWFEWITARLFQKKIIYDFDDAIWIPATTANTRGLGWLKNHGKVASICKWAHTVTVGNDFLAAYSRQYCRNVKVIPTVVDTVNVHNRLQDQNTDKPGIGWTGTFSTLKYLDLVLPALQELQEKYPFKFTVIADRDPGLPLKNYRFIPWNREREADDLLNFHIGLMPLYDDELSKGKCGFKAIQYMSLGIPAVVSPVGVNTEIVEDGVNGFVCEKQDEWFNKLELLLKDTNLRKKMGAEARHKIENAYSVTSSKALFLSLFSSGDTGTK